MLLEKKIRDFVNGKNSALCSVCLSVCVIQLMWLQPFFFLVIYWCESLNYNLHQKLCFSCIYNCSLNDFCKQCPLISSFKEYVVSVQENYVYKVCNLNCPRSQTNLMTQKLFPSVFYKHAGTDCLYIFLPLCAFAIELFIIELLWREYSLDVIFGLDFIVLLCTCISDTFHLSLLGSECIT